MHLRSVVLLYVGLMLCALPFGVRSQDSDGGGFATPDSVGGTLATAEKRQGEGALERYLAWKEQFAGRTGLSFGFDDQLLSMNTDSDSSPSNAAGNVFRFYGAWTATGRGTANSGALVFKVENRSAIGNRISPQALGPSLGYAGLFTTTFSDAGWILTNLYWRQSLRNGRVSFVIGQVDVTDYVDVNDLASPWTAFGNLAFEIPTIPAPDQGLGAAMQWRMNDHWGPFWAVLPTQTATRQTRLTAPGSFSKAGRPSNIWPLVGHLIGTTGIARLCSLPFGRSTTVSKLESKVGKVSLWRRVFAPVTGARFFAPDTAMAEVRRWIVRSVSERGTTYGGE
jgi:hypothetical protein